MNQSASHSSGMLLIVDPQIDFINGALPVPGSEKAMEALTDYVRTHGDEYSCIVVTCDRHPVRHCSFSDFGGQWPSHCVEASVGSAVWSPLMNALTLFSSRLWFLYKGEKLMRDEYSIFQSDEGKEIIGDLIIKNHIEEIDICGIAGDICVADTLRDALSLYPHIRFHILESFTASLDGGVTILEISNELNPQKCFSEDGAGSSSHA